jgi:hypothetical protein
VKIPSLKIKVQAPKLPKDRAVGAGLDMLASLAHHAPNERAVKGGPEKMHRPKGGKGPHN